MIDLTEIDITDFYFNNHWLSDFGGIVAGKSGFTSYSLLPSKEIKTEKIIGVDGELITNVRYNPRTFVVPVYFSDITRIRDIAGWLNVKKPMDFNCGKDMVKIKCMFDSAVDIQNYNLTGTTELKFIAHNPYFSLISESYEVFNKDIYDIALFRKYGKYEDRLSNIQKGYIKIALENKWFSLPQGKLKYKDGELHEKCDE